MVSKIEGYRDGDEVWVSAVYFRDEVVGGRPLVQARAYVRAVTVFVADRGLIDPGKNGSPRSLGEWETLHDNPRAGWLQCAVECRHAAERLLAEAVECERKAAVARGDVALKGEVA